jgi:LPS-assembly protein
MKKTLAFIGACALIFCPSMAAIAQTATLDARDISVDNEGGLVSARGLVEARAQGRVLSTEALTYDRQKAQLVVPNAMSLTESNGDKISAANAIIDNALETGRFNDMQLETQSSGRMKAASAERDGALLTLEDAIYTSCPECADPNDDPLWQIRASRISYDRAAQNVIYRHPRLEVYGIPVFYLPYMAHAGPEIDKRSGFLAPSLAGSSDFGTAVDMPYFFNLAPNYDLTLTPRISDRQEPFVTGAWRHLTGNGKYQLTAYAHRPRNELAGDTDQELRGGIIGDGQFALGDWSLGFALQDATDDLFFKRYKISNASRLTSTVSAQRRSGNHFITLEAFHFRETLTDEKPSTVGAILPSLTHQYDFAAPVFGGALAMTNRLTHRTRDQDIDETRLSSSLDWSWRHITQSGFVLSANNRLMIDAYDFTIEENDESGADADAIDDVLSANSAAFTLAYPLQRMAQNDRQTLSPKLQIVLADAGDDYDRIPYIGQTTRDLTKSQLFQPLTPKDEASRINIGLDHELNYKDRLTSRFFIGQSYNLSDETFDTRSGFGEDRSALITEAAIYAGALSLTQQARFSDDGSALLRSDSKLAMAFDNFNLGFEHSFYEAGQTRSDTDAQAEEATGRLGWQMSRNWRLDASLRENLETQARVRADAALSYEDDCTLITISFDRDYARIENIEPDTSVSFTFTLKTIGN